MAVRLEDLVPGLDVSMSAAMLRTRQLEGFARARRRSLAAAVEALEDVLLSSLANKLLLASDDNMQEVLAAARATLCDRMTSCSDRTPRVVAGYETALGAVATAWAWSAMPD